ENKGTPMNAQTKPALRGYHALISEATGYTDPADLQAIEDCMRDTIFHSTLDHLDRPTFDRGAREAVDVLVAMGNLNPAYVTIYDIAMAWGARREGDGIPASEFTRLR